jgi:hypothetical protein
MVIDTMVTEATWEMSIAEVVATTKRSYNGRNDIQTSRHQDSKTARQQDGTMEQAIALTRVSTSEQDKSGPGLAAQWAAIPSFANAEGFNIVEVVEEVASGKRGLTDREGLRNALAKSNKLKYPVIVSKLDHLSRDVVFISGLMSKGVQFIVAELGSEVDLW